jgi:hypothetical protein
MTTTTATLANGTVVNNGGFTSGTYTGTGTKSTIAHLGAHGGISSITMASAGTGYTSATTPYITVTGGGGGVGTGYPNQVLTTTTGGTNTWTTIGSRETISISADGDIFQGGATNSDDGLFARLERLERLMGIMKRDRNLERDYEPMRKLGDDYDDAVDAAIQTIMDVTLHKLQHMEQEYESMREQAKVWRALSKDD